ncbi:MULTISPECIES: hypothetical protein [Brevundimonas]|uniref:hypothetical protein n=1 Tax=Brevundimonas TaxID=41275 RepID=UPI000E0C1A32|nr:MULTISPECIES: hypothetical protein [Brevundimonas]NWE51197.1 hypothetical protein [Brevundimonas sp. P7753]WQE37671.1 hypothetical protein U0030_04085 [Brevundimonas bullata]
MGRRFLPSRTSLDGLDAIFAPIDQGQQITDLADFPSSLEPGPTICDLFEQGIDLSFTALAPNRMGSLT